MSLPPDLISRHTEADETSGARPMAYGQHLKVIIAVVVVGAIVYSLGAPHTRTATFQTQGGLVDNAQQQAALQACMGASKLADGQSGFFKDRIFAAQSQECFGTGINCRSVINYCQQRKAQGATQVADSLPSSGER